MKEVANVIKAIGQTSSYNDKLGLLSRYSNTQGLKDILKFIYNPYCKTGISNAKLSKCTINNTARREIDWHDAIEYFATHQTGSDVDLAFANDFIVTSLSKHGNDAMHLACAIVTQDLKIGITATSLNKVFGKDFIPKTGCMLGTLYGDVPASKISWPCIVTEKLDGIRRVLVKDGNVCRFYSRSGHEDIGLIEILEEAKYLPDGFVYDGELLAAGTFKDCIAQRQATNSIANSKGVKTGLTFNIFDMIPVKDFYNGSCKIPAVERKVRLGATLMDNSIEYLDERWPMLVASFGIHVDLRFIKPVPILGVVNNIEEVTPIVEKIWANGGEGVMLNTKLGSYDIKRSKQLLKIKHTEEHILPVVNFIEGSGKYEDSLGALVVLYTNRRGQQSYLGVGSGLTDAQRQRIWDNKDRYIGRKVEIECFGESTNANGATSLNCPIFKRFVGDVE